jgi:hypothetical protein
MEAAQLRTDDGTQNAAHQTHARDGTIERPDDTTRETAAEVQRATARHHGNDAAEHLRWRDQPIVDVRVRVALRDQLAVVAAAAHAVHHRRAVVVAKEDDVAGGGTVGTERQHAQDIAVDESAAHAGAAVHDQGAVKSPSR